MKEWDGEGDFSSRTFTLGWKKSGKIPKPLLASRPSPWHSRALTECRRLEELARRSPGPLTHRTLTTSRRQEAHRHRRPRCWSVNRSPHHSVTSNDEGKGEKEGVFSPPPTPFFKPSVLTNQVPLRRRASISRRKANNILQRVGSFSTILFKPGFFNLNCRRIWQMERENIRLGAQSRKVGPATGQRNCQGRLAGKHKLNDPRVCVMVRGSISINDLSHLHNLWLFNTSGWSVLKVYSSFSVKPWGRLWSSRGIVCVWRGGDIEEVERRCQLVSRQLLHCCPQSCCLGIY